MDETIDVRRIPTAGIHRRAFLRLAGISVIGVIGGACGFGSKGGTEREDTSRQLVDYSARFAANQAADEPIGDLAKVVWPEYVLRAGPEVQGLYAFQVENGELMRYMPCFCGCGAGGHRSNRDCYVRRVNPDGSVVFDDMAPT